MLSLEAGNTLAGSDSELLAGRKLRGHGLPHGLLPLCLCRSPVGFTAQSTPNPYSCGPRAGLSALAGPKQHQSSTRSWGWMREDFVQDCAKN